MSFFFHHNPRECIERKLTISLIILVVIWLFTEVHSHCHTRDTVNTCPISRKHHCPNKAIVDSLEGRVE